jgi:hypothetical protein
VKKRKYTPGKQTSAQNLVHGETPEFPGGTPMGRVFSKDYAAPKFNKAGPKFKRIDR